MPTNGGGNQKVGIQTTGAGPGFPAIATLAGQPGYPAAEPPIKGATVPYWAFGYGQPTYVAPFGSLYTDAGATGLPIFYVYIPFPNSPGRWRIIV